MFGEVDRWIWFAAGVVLVALEMAAPGIFLFWLGLAAFALGFTHLALLAAGIVLSGAAQLVGFAVLSVLAVLIGRALSKRSSVEARLLNQRADQLIGRIASLETAIIGGGGTICIDDTIWRVDGPDLPTGTRVRVVSVEGTRLRVTAA